jgi:membrane fusion protein (multidrug efflux system)
MPSRYTWTGTIAVALALAVAACGSKDAASDKGAGGGPPGAAAGGGRPGGGAWGGAPASTETAAVPVEVTRVARRSVAAYIETNGALEAEKDVLIVARTSGPIVDLATEEGRHVRKGQVMARIDPAEAKAQVQIAKVALSEAQRAYERAKSTFEAKLISQAEYDQALAAKETAEATLADRQVQLSYTTIEAPFDAVVVERMVKLADNVTPNQQLFRISDFDPLLCKIQVPEKELPRLHKGQPAYLTVEAWPKERFPAEVLRVSPVVDAATGTVRVTLEVDARERLRPGMFASVFLEADRRDDALTIPKSALSLESLGDTVYTVNGDVAARKPITLGYEEADIVEVRSGLEEGDLVITVGQDGLSDGTPIRILKGPGAKGLARRAEGGPRGEAGAPAGPAGPPAGSARSGADSAGPAAEARPPAGFGPPAGGRAGPPPPAVAACKQKMAGEACTFTGRRGDVEGTCGPWPSSPEETACVPAGWGGRTSGPGTSTASAGR